jgi:hypothetical protein
MKIIPENSTNNGKNSPTEIFSQHSPSFNSNGGPSPFFNRNFQISSLEKIQMKPQIKSILQKEKCRNDKNCLFTKEAEHCERYYHTCTKKGCNTSHDTHLNRFTHVCKIKNCTNQQELHLKQFVHQNQFFTKKSFDQPQIPIKVTNSPWKTPNDFQNPRGIRELESMKHQMINKNYYTRDDLLEMKTKERNLKEMNNFQKIPMKKKNEFTFDEFSEDSLDDEITKTIEFQTPFKNENNQNLAQFFTNSTPEKFQPSQKEFNPMSQFSTKATSGKTPLDVNDISQFFIKSNLPNQQSKETQVEQSFSNFIDDKKIAHQMLFFHPKKISKR